MRPITPAQHRILTAIQSISAGRGYSPTQRELAEALGVSRPVMHRHIQKMCDRGVLRKIYGMPYSIEIIGEGGE